MDRMTLDRFKVGLQMQLDAQDLAGFATQVDVAETITRQLAIIVQREVWGRQLDSISCRWPTTWRDAFKAAHGHRWWLRWWTRRHPVAYTCHVMIATAYWPSIKNRVHGHQAVLALHIQPDLGNGRGDHA